MKHFPIFVGTQDQRIAVIGGGEAATQKVRLLSRTEARIEIHAPSLSNELADLCDKGHVHHVATEPKAELLTGALLAIIATGSEESDRTAAHIARAAGALVNVVDRPALSDFTMPALVDRDPVVIAIGTEGTAPVLARRIKTRIERMLEPSLGRFAAALGGLRERVAAAVPHAGRRRFWEWATEAPRHAFANGDEDAALAQLTAAIDAGGAPEAAQGRISVIDPGAGEADLMTLRAVERLQTADLILHGSDCPQAILDLARRDAERAVLPEGWPPSWHRQRCARRALAAAGEGHQVVWLSAIPPELDADAPVEQIPAARSGCGDGSTVVAGAEHR